MMIHHTCPTCLQPSTCLDLVNRFNLVSFIRLDGIGQGYTHIPYYCPMCTLIYQEEAGRMLSRHILRLMQTCYVCAGRPEEAKVARLEIAPYIAEETIWQTFYPSYPIPETFQLKTWGEAHTAMIQRFPTPDDAHFCVLLGAPPPVVGLEPGQLRCTCNTCGGRRR